MASSRASVEQAFLAVYDAHADAVFRHCYFRVYDREVAKELMQEAFCRTWQYMASGEKIKNIRAMVYKIAQHLIIDRSRRKKEESLENLAEARFEPTTVPAVQIQVDGALLLDAMKELNTDMREVVYMRYIDDLTPKEIAEVTGLSANVISVRIHRGVKMLQSTIPPLINDVHEPKVSHL